jgi:hypothetical protein
MALIMARHEGAIDWSELDNYCVQAGQGEVLATYLAFGETLLGRQPPPLTARPDADAMRKLREYVDPSGRRPGRDVDVVSYRFSGTDAAHVAGHCWRVPLPNEFLQGDIDPRTRLFWKLRSCMRAYEPLGPQHFQARTVIGAAGARLLLPLGSRTSSFPQPSDNSAIRYF